MRIFRLLIVPTMVVGMVALLTATAYAEEAKSPPRSKGSS
jgi:hypothetical protein